MITPCLFCKTSPTFSTYNDKVLISCLTHGPEALGKDKETAIQHWNRVLAFLVGKRVHKMAKEDATYATYCPRCECETPTQKGWNSLKWEFRCLVCHFVRIGGMLI